jgi:hypothetical protein
MYSSAKEGAGDDEEHKANVSRVQQFLSVFFQSFARASTAHQQLLEEVFVLALHTSTKSKIVDNNLIPQLEFLLFLLTSRDSSVTQVNSRYVSPHVSCLMSSFSMRGVPGGGQR